MAQYVFKMPDIGEGIVETEVVEWHVAAGDEVAEDAPLADVMTDKATVEITSPVSGKVIRVGCEAGAKMVIGADFVEFDLSESQAGAIDSTVITTAATTTATTVTEPADTPVPESTDNVAVTPADREFDTPSLPLLSGKQRLLNRNCHRPKRLTHQHNHQPVRSRSATRTALQLSRHNGKLCQPHLWFVVWPRILD